MRTALTTVAAAVCVTALTAGIAPAAYAGKLVHQDARRDVVKIEFTGGTPQEMRVRRADPDILRIAVDYRPQALIVRTKYAELGRRVGRMEFGLIRTRDGYFTAQVQVTQRGRWQGHPFLIGDDSDNPDEPEVRCRGLRHRFDYDANVSIWTIPPACLGGVPWVRVGFTAAHVGGESAFVDNAFTKGTAHRAPLSARVWRGGPSQ